MLKNIVLHRTACRSSPAIAVGVLDTSLPRATRRSLSSSSSSSSSGSCPHHATNTRSTRGSNDDANPMTSTSTKLQIVKTLPYLGSIVPPYSNTPPFDPQRFYDYYPEKRRRHGDFYRMGFPGLGKGRDGLMYIVTDPNEFIKVIRQERGSSMPYPRGIVEAEWPLVDWLQSNDSVLARGTNDEEDRLGFAGRGATWKRLRTFLQTDLLSPQAAAGYVPIMAEAARLASRGAPASSDHLNAYTNRCSFDLFNSLMFGQLTKMADPDTGHDEDNIAFCQASVRGMEAMLAQLTSPVQLPLFKMGIRTKLYKDMASNMAVAFGIANEKVASFRARCDAGGLNGAEKISYLGRAIERQRDPSSNISEQDLVELINVSLVAAIDTTSSLLSWNMMHMALNPDVQEKLHGELTESICKAGGTINAEMLRRGESPYLHAVLRETHRLTPPAPITVMKENSLDDVEMHGSKVPQDSLICLDAFSVGLDPNLVDDPQEFRPERWLPPAIDARKGTSAEVLDHPYYRDPFSQGSRKCPGSRVANNEVLILLSQLVLDWRMEAPEGYSKESVEYSLKGMIHPTMPKLAFISRQG